jgi:UDP-glucose 4-epimerase
MKKRILVTGGTGFIGSHTVVELINSGYEPLVLDNLENSDPRVLGGIADITGTKPAFFQLDLRDKNAVKNFFDANLPIHAVIHFAAYKAVGESVAEPLKYYDNNISSLVHLLEEMQAHDIKPFVFSSSCTLYGEPDSLPVDENSPVKRPTSPYGNTKKVSEEILEEAAPATGLQSITLRYFNPVGAHHSGRLGELPIGVPNNLVPFITQTAAGLHKEVVVHGGDYPTPDGSCIRDYIHVVDLAKAHVIALERLLANKNLSSPEVFNLGTGRGHSVLEVIQAFERSTGQKLRYRIGPRRPGDVIQIYSDTKKANEVLGWFAKEDLDSMMRTAWNWQLNIPKYFPG